MSVDEASERLVTPPARRDRTPSHPRPKAGPDHRRFTKHHNIPGGIR
jgi:hypothetical protein